MWFPRVSINNPVFATMVMAAIMVLGLFSYQRLSVEQMPDISIPVAVVRTPYPGASAEAVEQEVTRRIEEAVNTVSGIRTIRSGSRAGLLAGGGGVRAEHRHQDRDPGRARQGGGGAPRFQPRRGRAHGRRAPTTTTTSRCSTCRCARTRAACAKSPTSPSCAWPSACRARRAWATSRSTARCSASSRSASSPR